MMASPARQEDDEFVLPEFGPSNSEVITFRRADVSDEEAFGLAFSSPNFGILTDVRFMVGKRELEEIRAHSLILARRSHYFWDMLFNWNDVDNRVNGRKTFWISTMEPGGFRIMLGYLYKKTIDLPPTLDGNTTDQVRLLLETLNCSNLTNEPDLENICTDLLMERLTVQNAINCLNRATKYKCTMFQQKVLEFIGNHIVQIIWSPEFNDFSENALVALLEYDHWNFPEYQIFDAVVEWAKNKHRVGANLGPGNDVISSETLRRVMGRTLGSIRFPLMRFNELGDVVRNYPGLLHDRERLILFDNMLRQGYGDAGPFTARRRQLAVRPRTNSDSGVSTGADSNQEENGNQNQNQQNVSNIDGNGNGELDNSSMPGDNPQAGGNGNGSQHEQNETGDSSLNNDNNDDLPEDHAFKVPPAKKSKTSTPMPSTSRAARARRQTGRRY